ncbi:MAG: hypothetical protein GX442_00830 [Candidatus Riflebacteria bacterium]|nr:hypothetical protein [Candidatus Riflebacteria bacterium]
MSPLPPRLPPEILDDLKPYFEHGETVQEHISAGSGQPGRPGELWLVLTERRLYYHTRETGKDPVIALLSRQDLASITYFQHSRGITLTFIPRSSPRSVSRISFPRSQRAEVERFCDPLAALITFEAEGRPGARVAEPIAPAGRAPLRPLATDGGPAPSPPEAPPPPAPATPGFDASPALRGDAGAPGFIPPDPGPAAGWEPPAPLRGTPGQAPGAPASGSAVPVGGAGRPIAGTPPAPSAPTPGATLPGAPLPFVAAGTASTPAGASTTGQAAAAAGSETDHLRVTGTAPEAGSLAVDTAGPTEGPTEGPTSGPTEGPTRGKAAGKDAMGAPAPVTPAEPPFASPFSGSAGRPTPGPERSPSPVPPTVRLARPGTSSTPSASGATPRGPAAVVHPAPRGGLPPAAVGSPLAGGVRLAGSGEGPGFRFTALATVAALAVAFLWYRLFRALSGSR